MKDFFVIWGFLIIVVEIIYFLGLFNVEPTSFIGATGASFFVAMIIFGAYKLFGKKGDKYE